jgi:hypothetical protein
MSRAQSTQVFNTATGNAATDQANAQKTGNAATSGYLGEQATPGYTPAEQTAITGATEGGLGAAFGSSAEGAANRAARTNNAAGLGAEQDALARQRMITSGNLGAQNATNFANARISGSQNANAGLAGLYGQNLGATTGQLGAANTASAANQSFFDTFGNSLAKSLGTIGGSVGSGGNSLGFG